MQKSAPSTFGTVVIAGASRWLDACAGSALRPASTATAATTGSSRPHAGDGALFIPCSSVGIAARSRIAPGSIGPGLRQGSMAGSYADDLAADAESGDD